MASLAGETSEHFGPCYLVPVIAFDWALCCCAISFILGGGTAALNLLYPLDFKLELQHRRPHALSPSCDSWSP